MGSQYGDPDEAPVHAVTVRPFFMSRSETTVGQYRACISAGGCNGARLNGYQWSGQPFNASAECNWTHAHRAAHPMNCVNWHQARDFCRWTGGRLPTEAEWEYAARAGGTGAMFPWGDASATCTLAVINNGSDGCGMRSTHPACSRAPGNTPQGVCDLAGNVWEWVSDYYAPDYYARSPATNPRGPRTAAKRVRRGGSWKDRAGYIRSANRHSLEPAFRTTTLGFRCAATAR